MAEDKYSQYHQQLLMHLRARIVQQPPFGDAHRSENDQKLLEDLDRVCDNPYTQDAEQHLGQRLMIAIVGRYPHITPMVPRDLFWFFGGECLHYLGEEEIAVFQQLDEEYHALVREAPETADYAKLRAATLAQQPQHLN